MGAGCLQEAQMVELVTILEKILQSHFEKQASRLGELDVLQLKPFLVTFHPSFEAKKVLKKLN